MNKETVNRRLGNYVVCETANIPAMRPGSRFGVRLADAAPGRYISTHPNVTDAVQAILRYQTGDKRRGVTIINESTGRPVTREDVAARFKR